MHRFQGVDSQTNILRIPIVPTNNRSAILIPQYIHRTSSSVSSTMPANPQKQMRRLPQVFSKVLELPLRSDADVLIEDRFDSFRFTAKIKNNAFSSQVKAHALKIHPQVTKVVVSGGDDGGEGELLLDKLEVDGWRFRLPETTRPELATAFVIARELIVTVPKDGQSSRGAKVEDGGGTWRHFLRH